MNTIKISAVLTAALLTGALSATAFAAETLTTTTGSITFPANLFYRRSSFCTSFLSVT